MMVGHGHKLPLASSTGENEINIPPRLESDSEIESDIYYMIDVKQGQTEIFAGIQTTNITLKNSLDEETTLHWHGLIIDSEADGGPHTVIQPGEEKEITFAVQEDKAQYGLHPHPEGKWEEHVVAGLVGLLYLEHEDNGMRLNRSRIKKLKSDIK